MFSAICISGMGSRVFTWLAFLMQPQVEENIAQDLRSSLRSVTQCTWLRNDANASVKLLKGSSSG